MADSNPSNFVTPTPQTTETPQAPASPPQPVGPPSTPPSETPTVPPSQPPAAPLSPHAPRKRNGGLWLLVIIIIIVIIGGGWYYWQHRNNSKTANTSTTTKQDIPLIRYGFINNPLNAFYPSDGSYGAMYSVQTQIFEGLVAFQNGTQIKPQLASSWSNPNSTTWVFHLKPNIYYHDGDKVTAADVVYSWQQVNKHPQGYGSTATTIKDVKALNNSTVQITTDQPDGILLNRLTQMFIIDSKAPVNTKPWGLGTGAYTVKPGTTPTANSLDIVAFNKWHGGHIYTKEVDYKFYADTTKAVKDLEAGKLDLVDELALGSVTNQLKQNFQLFKTDQTGNASIVINTVKPKYPTSNLKIRQALNLVIDPSKVLAASQSVGVPATQAIPPSIPGYNPAIQATQPNVTKAAALVKAAGYPNGVTVEMGIGEPTLSVAQEIAKEAKPAGINIKIDEATDEGTYFGNANNGTYQSFFAVVPSQLLDGSDILTNIALPAWYNNPDFSAQLNKAATTLDSAKHLKALQDASTILTNDREYIPLYQEQDLNATKKGIVFPLNDYDEDLNVYFANVYKQQ